MNTLLFLFFFLVMVPLSGFTRQFEFVVMGGYQFGGMVDETTQQEGVFTPGPALGLSGSGNWGVIADYRLGSKLLLELSFDRQPTTLNYHVPVGEHTEISPLSDITVDYYQGGLLYDWSVTRLKPFAGGTVGIVVLTPSDERYHSETHLAFAGLLGLRYFLTDAVALRLQGRFLLSKIPKGELFFSNYTHHKETFMSQIQFGLGIDVAL